MLGNEYDQGKSRQTYNRILSVKWYVDNTVAMIVLDKLYDSGEYKPLTQSEKATANLLVFSDRLPQ